MAKLTISPCGDAILLQESLLASFLQPQDLALAELLVWNASHCICRVVALFHTGYSGPHLGHVSCDSYLQCIIFLALKGASVLSHVSGICSIHSKFEILLTMNTAATDRFDSNAAKDGIAFVSAPADEFNAEARIAADKEHSLSFLEAVQTYPTAVAWSLFFSLGVIMAVSIA